VNLNFIAGEMWRELNGWKSGLGCMGIFVVWGNFVSDVMGDFGS
jgi:hypothetical protein